MDHETSSGTTFETTGSAWIGSLKASGSFVKLRAAADELSITTPLGSVSFGPREVIDLKPLGGLFGYGGFEIVHTVDRRSVQFRCRDIKTVRQRIAATGFVPRGVVGGGPDPARRERHDEENRAGNRRLFKIFAMLAAGFVAIFGAIAVAVVFAMKHGEVYETTWAAVQIDPRVIAVTGSPMTSTLPSGSVQVAGSEGTASIRYEASGPKGSGVVEAAGSRTDGRWVVDRFVFTPAGDAASAIDLGAAPR